MLNIHFIAETKKSHCKVEKGNQNAKDKLGANPTITFHIHTYKRNLKNYIF